MELPVDEDALKDARKNLCNCGSAQVVSSVTISVRDIDFSMRDIDSRWVCKRCHDELVSHLVEDGDTCMWFGHEGFLSDNYTIYDEMEIAQKVNEFNRQFEDKGYRARLLADDDFYCRMEVTVDDEQPRLAAAAKEAEHLKELCRGKIPFSQRRR